MTAAPENRVRDGGGRRAGLPRPAAVQGALAVAVVRPPVDAGARCGDASLEDAAEKPLCCSGSHALPPNLAGYICLRRCSAFWFRALFVVTSIKFKLNRQLN